MHYILPLHTSKKAIQSDNLVGKVMNLNLNSTHNFERRHIGPSKEQVKQMLKLIGIDELDTLIDETLPGTIKLNQELKLPEPLSEPDFLQQFKKLAEKNNLYRSFIGLGYYNTYTPSVILRNILENPGWYTAYTPYQAEISQGRLEALINFQTLVTDLTGMEIANASLLDEGTAAAEAMTMLYALRKRDKKDSIKFLVDSRIFPQTIDILLTRALPAGILIDIKTITAEDLNDPNIFGMILQYPDSNGEINDYRDIVKEASEKNIFVAFLADLLSLTLLKPPGEFGADVVVGTTQRFGIPLGYGGPHAAYFATREDFKRQLPGRIIGVSVDSEGRKAYRMALQTREQHIRREKATSNICTAQVLLAVMAGMYGVYHGPEGLRSIGRRIHGLTIILDTLIRDLGYDQRNAFYFDTLKIEVKKGEKEKIKSIAESAKINFRYFEDDHIGISLDETSSKRDIIEIIKIFAAARSLDQSGSTSPETISDLTDRIPSPLKRETPFLEHLVFHKYQSEHEILRYLKRLENKDLSLAHSMISLGSCTMKLNATTEMLPISWPELSNIHPFVPVEQVAGYQQMIKDLEEWLSEITGFAATSLQPNSGAQGEFSGLMVIRAYQESNGEGHRYITLIPSSAHGTNPASAVMAGTKVVIVNCDDSGNIDLRDLKEKAEKYRDELCALMVTYPSTHGVFEEDIKEICEITHKYGGQVYMDGANMNAQVGLTNPSIIGADVCHLNLHKTFCIPHGGGGPGVGPICVATHLAPFLPGNPIISSGGAKAISAVSAAPWGSAGILAISYAYIRLMGSRGLTHATKIAILNANYVKCRLEDHYQILYSGKNGRCAHEMILDCREFKKVNVDVEDIAKRLMDYGFHAPTVSFPVAGTLMIEPTESESLEELDRFCDALIGIRKEIQEIEHGMADMGNNVLKNAPHTQSVSLSDHWDYPYSREKAVYPIDFVKENKFWPAVSRIDSAFGDRNLFCSCIPVNAYQEQEELSK
jgi:glycine dehydrogenase